MTRRFLCNIAQIVHLKNIQLKKFHGVVDVSLSVPEKSNNSTATKKRNDFNGHLQSQLTVCI